ncbi:MAG: YceD family protein, partial [Actinomycetota bacterium]|nr:YceD family protein [Actinomycetota bacterium]
LEPAANSVSVDVREVDQPVEGVAGNVPGSRPGVDEGEDDDDEETAAELTSPYVEDGILNLSDWTRDALILALPNQILCREDCLGLCAYCGESLNGADPEAHDHGQNLDPRWSKLRDIS